MSSRPMILLSLFMAGLVGGCVPAADSEEATGADVQSALTARGTLEQIYVTHATPRAALTVFDQYGRIAQQGKADELGSKVFRGVLPGNAYSVVEDKTQQRSGKVFVRSVKDHLPSPDLYSPLKHELKPGFNYITTRDGTTLSAYVTLPGPKDKGPYPTVVAYSGYNPSQPGMVITPDTRICAKFPVLCDAPNDTSAMLASALGFATVSVNIRGTGCSGGAYDYFEPLQLTDGYDMVEVVAAQPWVRGHKVGMVGLSYPGITQLFVGSTRPPHLAAIAPMSVIGDTYTTLRPGGMMNDGFAISWVEHVVNRAAPYGWGWERKRTDAGDETCKENQLLHAQKIDNVSQAKGMAFYSAADNDRYNPEKLVGAIDVPVFLGGSLNDEQTGPFFTTLLDKFTASPSAHFVLYNGVHIDGFAPQVLTEWVAFLDLFVAEVAPFEHPGANEVLPMILGSSQLFKTPVAMPPSEWTASATREEALARWNAAPKVRAIFENGGVAGKAGTPIGTFEQRFDRWPPREQSAQRWFFSPEGTLSRSAPTSIGAASSFALDPAAGLRGILAPGGNVWDPLPAYAWRAPAAGDAVVMESAPLTEDAVMLGNGSADLWVRSTVDDADLEVNLSEVRPDGQEMYVQSGWMRASLRTLSSASTELNPIPTYAKAALAPLRSGDWTLVRVPLAAFNHVFRAGSKIRISVDTPGDSRAAWTFELKTFGGEVRYDIAHGPGTYGEDHASSLVLPLIAGVKAPSALPACPSLRGEPCRAYQAYVNTPAR